MSTGDDETPASRSAPSNANIDQRVARVESDLGRLSASFDGFKTLIDERFHTFGETLRRIESAVTTPNSTDAATAVTLADLTRRMSDQERKAEAQATEQTSMRAQINTVGAGVRWVGFGGVVTLIGLVAMWVATNGRIP